MKRKGFTLIELVMVIVIIGILAAVAVPRFMTMRAQAAKAACQSDVAAIRSALTSWYSNYTLSANGTTCPVDSKCDGSGYPIKSELESEATGFAQNFFSDAHLPPVTHIVEAGVANWGVNYEPSTGALNMTGYCGD